MRKELIVAVIIGSVLGLIVAFGLWRANSAISETKPKKSNTQASIQQGNAPNHSGDFAIVSPDSVSVSTSSKVTIQGIAKPNSIITVSGETDDAISKATTDGNFSIEVELSGGINELSIAAFSENAKPEETHLTIVFTTSIGEAPNREQAPADATDSIRQKIQQKLDTVSSKPRAVVGIVTDKTESGIQVKDKNSEIKQVSIVPGTTTFARVAKTTKSVEFTDLGIGDSVAVVGWATVNDLLDARRVIIQQAPNIQSLKAINGQITTETKKDITVNSSPEITIPSSSSPDVYLYDLSTVKKNRFVNLDEGENIVAIGELKESTLDARTIYEIVSSIPSPTPQ